MTMDTRHFSIGHHFPASEAPRISDDARPLPVDSEQLLATFDRFEGGTFRRVYDCRDYTNSEPAGNRSADGHIYSVTLLEGGEIELGLRDVLLRTDGRPSESFESRQAKITPALYLMREVDPHTVWLLHQGSTEVVELAMPAQPISPMINEALPNSFRDAI